MGQVLLKSFSGSKKMDGCGEEPRPCSDLPDLTCYVDYCGKDLTCYVDYCGKERRSWSDLPDLALHAIAMKLSTPFALCAFAGVCKSWRLVAKSYKSVFIASQPPLLLLLPDIRPPSVNGNREEIRFPTISSSSFFRFYSVTENRIYRIARDRFSPVLASVVSSKDLYIVGHSYGYLITASRTDKRTPLCDHIPTLVSLHTGKTISFPRCNFPPQRGMLTSPPHSGSSMLILYNVMHFFVLVYCCRRGDRSGCVYMFNLPRVSWVGRSVRNAIVHGGMLYVSILGGEIMIVEASSIKAAALANMLTVARERGITMISLGRSLSEVVIHNTLIDDGRLRGGWEGRMMEDWYVPCASTYSLFWIDAKEEGSLIDNPQWLFCAGGDGLWIHPCELPRFGFKDGM